jgi:hypothetical protein
VQRILRHSSITVTTGTYVEAVQGDALDSMGTLFAVEPEKASGRSQLSSELSSIAPRWPTMNGYCLVELRGLEPLL